MKNKQHRSRITRISRQRRSTLYRSMVMKLAYVAPDRLDIAEAVKCLTRHVKEKSQEWINVRTQEVRSILEEGNGDVC